MKEKSAMNGNIALDRPQVQVRTDRRRARELRKRNAAGSPPHRRRMTCVMTHQQCQRVNASFI